MTKNQKLNNKASRLYRSFIATALLANGIFQFVAPVLAEGTAAGQSISNTATATYEDPNSPGTTINATSNTVVVTVAEVAGITVTAAGTSFKTDTDGQGAANPGTADGKVNVGDSLYYTYNVTNVGNDPTKFRIPDQPAVTGPGQLDPSEKVQISYNGGTNWVDVASGGTITQSIAPDASVLVRVPVIVAKGAVSGDTITVKLGNTSPEAQNVLRSEDGGDVYTVDNNGTENGDIAGAPINGVREASVSQQVKVDASIKSYTLATLLKNRTGQTNAGAAGPGGDIVSYGLSLRVEDKDPTGNGISPAPLTGTTVPGLSGSQILVSDAIPAGTKLASVQAPVGWQVVYTTENVSTNANQATWTTTAPADLATVKRVGFIRTGSIAPGTTVSGFQINVEVTGTPNSITIANIAQLFGSSPSGAPVYDESGDQNPSNYDGSNPPGEDTNKDGIPDTLNNAVNDGYIDPADTNSNGTPDDLEEVGIDQSNNNTGTGAGGEANIFTLNTAENVSLLTGPKDAPDAVSENDNNKDFTNKSSLVPAGTKPNSKIDPDGVSFTNTVKNTGIAVANISLLPTLPDDKDHLPDGTFVTITYGSLSATYEYNKDTGFTFKSAQGQVNGFNISKNNPIRIDGVQAGATANYGVEVNLPKDTPLSTDIQRGFPAPITAFVDSNNDGVIDSAEAKNRTIDRVYTGFLRLIKESRILKGTGPDVLPGQGDFSQLPKTPAPGNIVEYSIRYKNISEAQGGTGNIILNARKVVITEDGTAGGNNWALDNDNNGEIDTSNIRGSAQDSDPNTAKITLFKGNPATVSTADQAGTTVNTDVTKYINTVNTDVTPGNERTFSFQRLVNGKAATGTRSTTNN